MKRRARHAQFREGVRRIEAIHKYTYFEKYQEKHGRRMVKVVVNGIEFHDRLKHFPSDELIARVMLAAS